jgi:cell division protein FtsB
MTPEDFKRYFEARRRVSCHQEPETVKRTRGPVTAAGRTAGGNTPGVRAPQNANNATAIKRSTENKRLVPRLTSGTGIIGKAEVVVHNLEVIAKNSDLVNITKKTAVDWIAVDAKENRAEGEKKKIPFSTMLVILTVSLALLLVVAGTVITSEAQMELSSMEDQLEELTDYKKELELKIDIKNDLKYIEMVARTKLGMVDREYAAVKFIGSESDDKVVIYNTDENGAGIGLSTLLSALGFPG